MQFEGDERERETRSREEESDARDPSAPARDGSDPSAAEAGAEPYEPPPDYGLYGPYAFDPYGRDYGASRAAGAQGGDPGAAAPSSLCDLAPEERPPVEDAYSAVQRDALAGIAEHHGLVGAVVEVLRELYDPEIPVNIYDLGLVYDVREVSDGHVYVRMTLTSPMCPVAESLPPEVKRRVEKASGVAKASVEITWDPPWGPEKMSEAARLQLNFF